MKLLSTSFYLDNRRFCYKHNEFNLLLLTFISCFFNEYFYMLQAYLKILIKCFGITATELLPLPKL